MHKSSSFFFNFFFSAAGGGGIKQFLHMNSSFFTFEFVI